MIYLLILMFLIGCMMLIDARGKLFFFSHWIRAAVCLLLATAFFVVWDVLAIRQGIFLHLDSPLMTGVMIGPQFPVEEILFLIFLSYSSIIAVLGLPRLWDRFRETRSRTENQNVS